MAKKFINNQQFFEMYLEFHEKIFKIHVKCMQHLVAVIPFQELNQIDVAEKLDTKKPIIDADNLIISEKDLEKVFDQIFPLIKKYSYRQKGQVQRFEELYDRRRIALLDMVRALISGNNELFTDISSKYDISPLLLERVSELIISPYFELCAELFNKRLGQQEWKKEYCPICGFQPSMALVNEQLNTRLLWCRFCDTTWSFQNMVCPYCLNDDPKQTTLIFPPNNKPFRIDACQKCNNYIKTVDELIIYDKQNLSVRNVATYYLDLLAMKFGFNVQNYFKFYVETIFKKGYSNEE